jgi:hypothetical protein
MIHDVLLNMKALQYHDLPYRTRSKWGKLRVRLESLHNNSQEIISLLFSLSYYCRYTWLWEGEGEAFLLVCRRFDIGALT